MNAFQKKITLRVLGIHAAIVILMFLVSVVPSCFKKKDKDIVTFIEFGEAAPAVSVQQVANMTEPEPTPPEPEPEPVPIPEPGAFRPISLLCVMDKVMQGTMVSRIFEEVRPKLHPSWYGSRPNLCATQCLMQVTDCAERSRSQGLETALLSIDFKQAFDRASRARVIQKIVEKGVNPLGLLNGICGPPLFKKGGKTSWF